MGLSEAEERELLELLQLEEQLKNETSMERLARRVREQAAHPDYRPLPYADTLERIRRLVGSIERKKAEGLELNVEEKEYEAKRKVFAQRRAEDQKILERRWAERKREGDA